MHRTESAVPRMFARVTKERETFAGKADAGRQCSHIPFQPLHWSNEYQSIAAQVTAAASTLLVAASSACQSTEYVTSFCSPCAEALAASIMAAEKIPGRGDDRAK